MKWRKTASQWLTFWWCEVEEDCVFACVCVCERVRECAFLCANFGWPIRSTWKRMNEAASSSYKRMKQHDFFGKWALLKANCSTPEIVTLPH